MFSFQVGYREFQKKSGEEQKQGLLIEQLRDANKADDARTNELMNAYMVSLMHGEKEPSVEALEQMYMLVLD